jgi:hypothetical protein
MRDNQASRRTAAGYLNDLGGVRVMRRTAWAIAALSLAVWVGQAQAAVITFNGVPSVANPTLTSLTTDGFTFTSGHFHTIDTPALGQFGGLVDNGSIYIAEEAGSVGLPITMVEAGGQPFGLVSFDGAELFLNAAAAAAGGFPNANQINVLGNLSGGGTVNAVLGLDGIADGAGGAPDFQTFILPASFTNLASVTFSGSVVTGAPGAISLDNINTGVIPAPGALLLGGIGAGLVTWFRRRTA